MSEHDSDCGCDGGQEGLGASVIAGGDSAPVFRRTEGDLDAVGPPTIWEASIEGPELGS